jgi:hypothetical protein
MVKATLKKEFKVIKIQALCSKDYFIKAIDINNINTNNTFIVAGDYGELTVDKETGKIINYDHEDSEPEYSDIIKIDVESIIKAYGKIYDVIDIVNAGFWTDKNVYIESCYDSDLNPIIDDKE